MILRLFKGTGPGVIFLILITVSALWMSAFFYPSMDSLFHYETEPMPLYGLLKLVIGNNHFLGVLFSFSMVALMAFLLVNFNTTVLFINERTFLPALIYVLISGLFPQYQLLNPVLPASLFLMLAVIRIMDGYRKPGVAFNFFDAGILIGTGSFFYANLIWFGLLVLIGIVLLRTGNLKEIAISILGLITPYLLAFGFYYIIGKDLVSLLWLIGENLFGKTEDFLFSRLNIIALIIASLLILISIIFLVMSLNTKKIKSRKIFSLLVWVFLISLGIYFFLPSGSVEIVWLISIPVSYFLAYYFVFVKKKLVPEIFFSALFVIVIVIQIWYRF